MNRRQLLKGLISAPIAAVTVAELAREAPEPSFGLAQPKAEGSEVEYDQFSHDGTDMQLQYIVSTNASEV